MNNFFFIRKKINLSHNLVLASKSQIRKKILKRSGLDFSVYPSNIDEKEIKKEINTINPKKIALELAKSKALQVGLRFPESLVIGLDQVCWSKGKIFNKPGNKYNALKQLKLLNGNAHNQYSALCIAYKSKIIWRYIETAELKMNKLTDKEINNYVIMDNPIYSCGSYKFESLGCHLFSKIKGSNDTIQGFPLIPFLNQIRKLKFYTL